MEETDKDPRITDKEINKVASSLEESSFGYGKLISLKIGTVLASLEEKESAAIRFRLVSGMSISEIAEDRLELEGHLIERELQVCKLIESGLKGFASKMDITILQAIIILQLKGFIELVDNKAYEIRQLYR